MMGVCTHCQAPRGAGSAKGLCSRCYVWTRRHDGALPPRERTVSADLSEALEVRMTALLLAHVRAGAAADGVAPSAWVRRACEERALRRARKPR